MLKVPLRILIVAALCVTALVSLVVRESMARAAGTEVLLAMEAVDPRALLSGHYVIIGLAETLPEGQACPPGTAENRVVAPNELLLARWAWVALRPNGNRHSLAGVADTEGNALALAPIAAMGTAWCAPPTPAAEGAAGTPANVRLDLGISRFHINQTDAERIDRLLRAQTSGETQRIYAIVSIGQDGRARMKGLQVDGERLELSWL
jgi:uncharacterized membrane-anchored protein